MLKLSKRVEYALLAVQALVSRPAGRITAKDVSTQFGISQALVAKVLQQLASAGVVQSFHGINGGYIFARDPECVTIANVIEAVEGKQGALVDCHNQSSHVCSLEETCTIKQPLAVLQHRMYGTLESMSVAELATTTPVQIEVTLP